ncbi:ArnT family glycosyltransferase, partial [Singulisphaera rosea]
MLDTTTSDPIPDELEAPSAPGRKLGLEWGVLATITVVAAVLRLWKLDQNGYGNLYYAAAVRSMLESFGNFFFGALDPGGFVTVDKPPVALWIQALSAKVFGFEGVNLLWPQALLGVATVVLTYAVVRKPFGAVAA